MVMIPVFAKLSIFLFTFKEVRMKERCWHGLSEHFWKAVLIFSCSDVFSDYSSPSTASALLILQSSKFMKQFCFPGWMALVMPKQRGRLQTYEVYPLKACECHG